MDIMRFKHTPPRLPDNRSAAEIRLQCLGRRLSRDETLSDKYRLGMADLIAKGHASKVADEEVARSSGVVWYLPHHPVVSPKKPNKVRIVFDCAAKYKRISLNDEVLQGPELTNQLIRVLLRFRQQSVAVMADIVAMFHQVRVTPDERDVLRYLWWPNGDRSKNPETYKMNVHLFGGTWSPSCCNFALQQLAKDNENHFETVTVNTVLRNFYVDDCLKSVDDENEAIELVRELTDLLSRGGFKLTKWVSTSRKVLASMIEADRSQGVKNIDLCYREKLPTDRALGVSWNVENDCFVFKMSHRDSPLTRRGLLSTACSVYDPMGFISPYTVIAKRIFQDLTRNKSGWDEPLPDRESREWLQWLNDLVKIESVKIRRCLKLPDMKEVEYRLHHFSDASNTAYGVVTYLRAVSCSGIVNCSLLMAKSRLAPIKTQTMPKLELMAATLAVKVDQMIQRELDLPLAKSVFWTDSTIVLQYIRNEQRRFHTFVANRIAVIRDASLPQQWRHVTAEENAADDVSRGLNADDLIGRLRW